MRIGIAHHLGWAVAVAAGPDHTVVDRRRIELVEPGVSTAPVHHDGGAHPMHDTGRHLDDDELAALVAEVQASVVRAATRAFDEIQSAIGEPVTEVVVRGWPVDFPTDIAILRRPPYESRVDSVMYAQVLAEVARSRGWSVSTYDAKTVEADAARVLGDRAHDVLHGPRATLGPPWTKDHRSALAATVVTHLQPQG